MRGLIIVVFCWVAPQAFAFELDTAQPITAHCLAQEVQQVVPHFVGLDEDTQRSPGRTVITFHRDTGEFTLEEQALLADRLRQHDPACLQKGREQRATHRSRALEKLRALGLTPPELEALFGS